MTACAIEDGTAEAAGTGETVEPGSDEPGSDEPAEAEEVPDPAPDPAASAAALPEPLERVGPVGAVGPEAPPEPVASAAALESVAPEPVPSAGPPEPVPGETALPAFTLTADGAYAARLTTARGSADSATGAEAGDRTAWYAERWTLDGPEPYAVPLPLDQPEEADSQVLPLADGRVLIRRRVAGRHAFSLLYPTGPGTGELPLGALECDRLTLLPPSPDGVSAYALTVGTYSTGLWLVAGGAFGPEHIADLPGRCSGGVWLDRAGRLLALDREPAGGGPVKAVAVDLGRGAEMTPLLQIAPDSNDRLLLADPDSGLLLIRSDAPGHDRLGWGVLGSCLPVRFPECLRLPDVAVTPFAVQPGQMLMPESCAVALRIDGAAGSWAGIWRPSGRRLHHLAAPEGWLAGSGVWSRDGVLKLPYANGDTACAVALLTAPADVEPAGHAAPDTAPAGCAESGRQPSAAVAPPPVCRPVPLGQAPLVGRTAPD
ncbi:hypothetical protein [Streptomyces sp. NBC_01022]|uniref:hypothetical protein n=1 Tax=Streptomyces sp. NBC_01022 TaxID=2903723 RepID=UPI002DDB3EBD|nr:hypothetical protein [Streptomyces sp. NBC_01022]WRZ81463.1 hypothetical protein OG316_14895 [Streptomyces sp. NBC_01022]